ncbi:hypothetical protein ROZALSC1DRAFT_22012 [Rozella allomycis CSF55]|uniref:Ankyrin n=1 Tax=Rozella allomycis (strain CSF55) TaxID=988480 RepID=A0A4P9YKT2_ROZAC|nr:hypothetical protein ROZALSC1DRAFT_22012 [Rozella allomycis CSF55]
MGNLAIRLASQIGHTEVVKVLLNDSRVDPHNYAIASKNGHSSSICLSSHNGHARVGKLLMGDTRVKPRELRIVLHFFEDAMEIVITSNIKSVTIFKNNSGIHFTAFFYRSGPSFTVFLIRIPCEM